MQKIVNFLLYEITHKLVHTHTAQLVRVAVAVLVGRHIGRAEFYLGLTLERRLNDVDGDGCHNAAANVREFKILLIKILYCARKMLTQSTLVRSALRGVLTIDKRIIILAVLVDMGEGDFNVVAFQVDNRIERLFAVALLQQIEQAVARHKLLTVENKRQTCVQIGVVAQHCLNVVGVEVVGTKHRLVGRELHLGAVALGGGLQIVLFYEFTRFKISLFGHSVAERPNRKLRRQRIDSLCAHAVQTNRFLERFGVILRASIHNGNGSHHLALRNAAAIVAHGERVVLESDVDGRAELHSELVYRVVNHFF